MINLGVRQNFYSTMSSPGGGQVMWSEQHPHCIEIIGLRGGHMQVNDVRITYIHVCIHQGVMKWVEAGLHIKRQCPSL